MLLFEGFVVKLHSLRALSGGSGEGHRCFKDCGPRNNICCRFGSREFHDLRRCRGRPLKQKNNINLGPRNLSFEEYGPPTFYLFDDFAVKSRSVRVLSGGRGWSGRWEGATDDTLDAEFRGKGSDISALASVHCVHHVVSCCHAIGGLPLPCLPRRSGVSPDAVGPARRCRRSSSCTPGTRWSGASARSSIAAVLTEPSRTTRKITDMNRIKPDKNIKK